MQVHVSNQVGAPNLSSVTPACAEDAGSLKTSMFSIQDSPTAEHIPEVACIWNRVPTAQFPCSPLSYSTVCCSLLVCCSPALVCRKILSTVGKFKALLYASTHYSAHQLDKQAEAWLHCARHAPIQLVEKHA